MVLGLIDCFLGLRAFTTRLKILKIHWIVKQTAIDSVRAIQILSMT